MRPVASRGPLPVTCSRVCSRGVTNRRDKAAREAARRSVVCEGCKRPFACEKRRNRFCSPECREETCRRKLIDVRASAIIAAGPQR